MSAKSNAIALLIPIIFICDPARAQAPSPEVILKVTPAEVSVLARGLDAIPFDDVVVVLIIKLQKQLDDQTTLYDAKVPGGSSAAPSSRQPSAGR
jgi:hypothetical protein